MAQFRMVWLNKKVQYEYHPYHTLVNSGSKLQHLLNATGTLLNMTSTNLAYVTDALTIHSNRTCKLSDAMHSTSI